LYVALYYSISYAAVVVKKMNIIAL